MRIATILRALTAGLCVLLLSTGLSACQQRGAGVSQTEEGQLVLGEAEQTAPLERGVDLAGRTLVLDGFRGTVTLTGDDVEAASLVFTKQARGRSDKQAADVLGRITVQETGDAATYTYTVRSKEPTLSAVAVEGVVPRATSVHVQLSSGDVWFSAIDGPMDVTVESGDVTIGGVAASVTVETRNGAIDLGMMRLPAQGTVRLRTTNGDLTLTLPGSTNARVEAQTRAGDITTEGLTFSKRRLNPEAGGARFQGQLGTGVASITLRTENGAIILREGTVRRLAPRTVPAAPVDSAGLTPGADSTGRAPAMDSLITPIDSTAAERLDTLQAPTLPETPPNNR